MRDDISEAALSYHRSPKPGKLAIVPTKRMLNQRDLAMAYSPGVAAACREIVDDPEEVSQLTSRSNLVAVITNGTAVLGLGSIGPLAAKPVMEGKAVLFKKFADIDVFDLELDTTDVDRFVDAVSLLEATFGGINLEDIKAPECFEIEKKLRERMNIPVFHDDQHGTAICVAAAIRNGLDIAGKKIEDVKIVVSGAGAAAIACLNLLVAMGAKKANIAITDIVGVVYKGREELMDPYKAAYAIETDARTLDDVIDNADVFLGLSAPKVLKAEQVARMAATPFILALANPEPEIRPELVESVRSDAIIATGRSDYPNQVNNVLCFPFIFRGALDVGATTINDEMKIACVEAIANMARKEVPDTVAEAYGGKPFQFGKDYLIPKPFDPRLIMEIPVMVAQAAMDSGVATRPIKNFDDYRHQLSQFVFRSGMVMKPIFERARKQLQKVVFAEGESRRVAAAVQELVDSGTCYPILIGRPKAIQHNMDSQGLRVIAGIDFDIVDPNDIPNEERYIKAYHDLTKREGVSPKYAEHVVRTRGTALAALMVRLGDADAVICGVQGSYVRHLRYVRSIIGMREGVKDCAAVTLLLLPTGTYFLTDTHVTINPDAARVAEIAEMASRLVKRFGIKPKIALLSHSNFGSRPNEHSFKMQQAREILEKNHPDLQVEGEMHADTAVWQETRDRLFPNSAYEGEANLFVFPNLDAGNITYNALKALADAQSVGPMLTGIQKPAHVVTDTTTVKGIVNMTAVAVVQSMKGDLK
jgi:malate dehydrogenase (oxaloacetate-decarboxylating)(NADP+)